MSITDQLATSLGPPRRNSQRVLEVKVGGDIIQIDPKPNNQNIYQ